MNVIKNKAGVVQEIRKNGETLWTREHSLNRSKISDKSRDSLRSDIKDIQDDATKEALKDIYHILTGEKV